jgi:hypothetical protein
MQEQKFTPQWEGSIEGYVINSCRKNLWKFARLHYEMTDLVSEAWLVFHDCLEYYPDVQNAKHFMSLFKTAWFNRMYDIINPTTRCIQAKHCEVGRKYIVEKATAVCLAVTSTTVIFEDAEENQYQLSPGAFIKSASVESPESLEEAYGVCTQEESTFRVVLREAPREVLDVLNLIYKAPEELLQAVGITKEDDKQLTNSKLCKLLGYDANKTNLVKSVKEYFSRV